MLPDSPPPHLDRFRAFASERGQEVRRVFDWGGEFEWKGETIYVEPHWETILAKEEKVDERLFGQYMEVADRELSGRIWEEAWAHLIELNEAAFERVLEEHGVDSSARDSGR